MGAFKTYENINIKQCYKCCQFFHKSEECKNNVICPKCGQSHKENECNNEQRQCVNCSSANTKYKMKHKIDHSSNDLSCPPTYLHHLEVLRSKIDYNTNNG